MHGRPADGSRPREAADGAPTGAGLLATLLAMPPAVRVFLGYGFLVLGLIALSLRYVVEQANEIPISPLGVLVMALLAYTIFTMTLTLQRKAAARPLAIGLASLSIPAVPLLFVSGLTLPAVVVALLAATMLVGLTRPAAGRWLSEP
jgi:hypothetical protein